MEIHVKESTIVRPAEETPKHRLWISNLDLFIAKGHVQTLHLYRRPTSEADDDDCPRNFFDAGVLKQALSRVLVAFYPVAGRLAQDENGRLEVDCNAEGVLYIEAETNLVIEDLGDFTPSSMLCQLTTTLDTSKGVSSYPLLVVQATTFKCGGVSLGIGLHHILTDGTSAFHFINSWAEVARGVPISVPPFLDRTILREKIPPNPTFDHTEYHTPPSKTNLELQSSPRNTSVANLKLSIEQINALKEKLNKENDHGTRYSTYEILAPYIWRCVCKARHLPSDQLVRLQIPIDGRSRLNPPLPPEFFGNMIFITAIIASAGDIQSKPLIFTVKKIREAVKRRDDEYLRSALAYLEQNLDVVNNFDKKGHSFRYPNLKIVSWARMPAYETDFGWGAPIFAGRTTVPYEGASYILPSPCGDSSLSLIICLETHEMEVFKKLLYDF